MPIKDLIWGNKYKKAITGITAIVIGITSSIIGVHNAAPVVEPWWFAHRLYVRDTSTSIKQELEKKETETLKAVNELQLDFARGKRDEAENNIAKWQNELSKPDSNKDLVGQQLRSLQDTKSELERQIRTLQRKINQ
jgi:hypothetical protein